MRALLLLEGAEIGVLGQLAPLAQPLQHLVEIGLGAEPVLLETPEPREGGVEEGEPRVGAVDRDGDGDVLQHLGMGRDVARELGLLVLELGEVAGVADDVAVGAERRLGDVDEAARAADDDVVALGLRQAGLGARAMASARPPCGTTPAPSSRPSASACSIVASTAAA